MRVPRRPVLGIASPRKSRNNADGTKFKTAEVYNNTRMSAAYAYRPVRPAVSPNVQWAPKGTPEINLSRMALT